MKKDRIHPSARVGKLFRGFALAFLVLFVLRWGYEVFFTGHDILLQGAGTNASYEITNNDGSRLINYASSKITTQDTKGQTVTMDQKYEKTANLSALTTDFTQDNALLRQAIAGQEAVIQAENLSGLSGGQMLTVTIGVIPEHFDALVERLRGIGNLQNLTVSKVDKTDTYRKMLASQATLIKTSESYTALKEKGGSISDMLKLEEKLLEVERDLQALGVDIDLFSSEQSFCTVNYSLREAARQTISVRFLLRSMQNSFFWTLGLFVMLALLAGATWLLSIAVVRTREIWQKDGRKDPPAANDAGDKQS